MEQHAPESPGGGFSVTLGQHLLDLLAWHGLPAESILAAAGTSLEALADHGGWVPASQGQKMLHAAVSISGDPFLFLKLSKNTFHAGYGVVGQLVQACPTLKEVIMAITRFEPLLSDIGISRLAQEPGRAVWSFECRFHDPVFVRHVVEFIIGCRYFFLLMVREKRSNIVLAVHFQHAAPDNAEDMKRYEEVFRCPVHFDQPETALILVSQALSLPLRQADTSFKDVFEIHAQKKLEQLQVSPSFLEQARQQLRMLLQSGSASREHLAGDLGISARHLYRQLQREGSSYRDILDELRLEIAQQSLGDSGRTVDDVGRLLGFSEGQSFIRWFRQATRKTPGEYRSQDAGPPGNW